MGCGNLYRLWNSHLARKGIIQFAALVLISQVELVYLPVSGYLRQMDSRAAELSLAERAIAMESAYYYYGAYVTADSGAVAAVAEGEKSEQEAQAQPSEGIQLQIVDSGETGISMGIQIQPEIQEEMLKEQEAAEIPLEEYFRQMLRENGIEASDHNLTDNESGQNKVPYSRCG